MLLIFGIWGWNLGSDSKVDFKKQRRLVHLPIHRVDIHLAWFEWVPSGTNISDLPSRDPSTWDEEARQIMARLRTRVRKDDARSVQYPSAAELDAPAAMLARAARLERACAEACAVGESAPRLSPSQA